MTLTITEISKENHASVVVKIVNHASRYYAQSRLTRLIWDRSRITLIIWVPSRVTENPFTLTDISSDGLGWGGGGGGGGGGG